MGDPVTDDIELARARTTGGFTLVEMLLSVALLGLLTVTMGSMITGTVVHSRVQRDATVGEAELRRFAEKLRAGPYIPCAEYIPSNGVDPEINRYEDVLRPDLDTLPAGVTIDVVKVEFWEPTADATDVSVFKSHDDLTSCTIDPPTDNQIQRITLEVHAGIFTRKLTVVKRVFQ